MMEKIQANKCLAKITKDIANLMTPKNCDANIYEQKNIFETNMGCVMYNVILKKNSCITNLAQQPQKQNNPLVMKKKEGSCNKKI